MFRCKRLLPFLLCIALSPVPALADGKVAVVSRQQAMLNTDLAQQRLKDLQAQADFADSVKRLNEMQQEGQKLVERLKKDAAVMSDAQKTEADKKLRELQTDIQHYAKKLQEAQNLEVQRIFEELSPRLRDILLDIIKKDGIGLLLDQEGGAVLHVDSGFDITAKVTDRLNRKN